MAKTNTNPEVRFAGFQEDWEEKDFEKVFINISNNSLSREKLNYDTGLAKNVHYGDILVKFNDVLDVRKEILPYVSDNATVEKLKNSFLKDGDIIISDAAEDETVGKCVELYNVNNEKVLSGLHTIAVRPKEDFAPKYLGYYLNSDFYHNQLLKLMQGTKVLSVSKTSIKKTVIRNPKSKDEQKLIGNFFENIDNLITEHQQKHAKLKALKQAMLGKMFPKQGQLIPEIRFKEFEGEWEEKRLRVISIIITKGTTPLDKSNFGEISFVKIENITSENGSINITSKISLEEHNGYLQRSQLQEGDILFSIAGTLGRVAIIPKQILPANTNQALAIIRLKDISVDYVATYLKGKGVKDFVRRNPTVGAQPNLSLEQVGNIEIPLPNYYEQKKIGDYFKSLDELIKNHNTQLVKLQNIKKAFLSKMYI